MQEHGLAFPFGNGVSFSLAGCSLLCWAGDSVTQHSAVAELLKAEA